MAKFLSLIKFEFMSNRSLNKNDKLFSRIKTILLTILGVGCIAAIFLYAINVVMEVFISSSLEHEFLTFFSSFMMIVLLVVGVAMSTKTLFLKVNLSLLKLPVDGKDIFFSKLVYLYVKELFFAVVIALPVFLMFGIKTMQGAGFYLMLLPNILFLPVIPFFAAVLVSMPVMWVIKFFKTKFFVLLILYILMLAGAFVIYIFALKFILRVMENGNFANFFDNSTVFAIRQFASHIYLSLLIKNGFLLYDFWRSALINMALTAILWVCIYLFAERAYLNVIVSGISQSTFRKKTKVEHKKTEVALMGKEFKNIFRSTNYAFQYLTIVVSTPLMVYFSSEIASSVGASTLGKGVLPGIAVLVLLMFLSMGTSFSATSITREGGNFFLTKIIPVRFTRQIFVKLCIYLIISIPSIFISCFTLAFAGFVDFLGAFLMSISISFVIIGNICHSISLDVKRPQFQSLENGEVESNNKNISSSIGLGFFVAVLMGVAGIVISFFMNVSVMFVVLFAFGLPYAGIEIFRLFYRLEKRYNAIEV